MLLFTGQFKIITCVFLPEINFYVVQSLFKLFIKVYREYSNMMLLITAEQLILGIVRPRMLWFNLKIKEILKYKYENEYEEQISP